MNFPQKLKVMIKFFKKLKFMLLGQRFICVDHPIGGDSGCKITGYLLGSNIFITKIKRLKTIAEKLCH